MDGSSIRRLIDGAEYLFTNEYESHLASQKTGWSEDEIASRVRVQVKTRGKDGATIRVRGEETVEIAAARETHRTDPTGVGDAFRAGFLTGAAAGLDALLSAQLGSMLATYVLETVGTQEYTLRRGEFLGRLAEAYGDESAQAIARHITIALP
jgi:adenosine kinase